MLRCEIWTRLAAEGEIISELARTALMRPADQGVARDPHSLVLKDGWYLLPSRGGTIVTNELVECLLGRADAEDAGIAPDE